MEKLFVALRASTFNVTSAWNPRSPCHLERSEISPLACVSPTLWGSVLRQYESFAALTMTKYSYCPSAFSMNPASSSFIFFKLSFGRYTMCPDS